MFLSKYRILICFLIWLSCRNSVQAQLIRESAEVMPQPRLTEYVKTDLMPDQFGIYPGAVMPFGMVTAGPFNDSSKINGYNRDKQGTHGFSIKTPEVDGCYRFGGLRINLSTKDSVGFGREMYTEEVFKPGYYSAFSDQQFIKAEFTTSYRTAIGRFTSDHDVIYVQIAIGDGIKNLNIISSNETSGYYQKQNICDSTNQKVFFYIQFNIPFSGYKSCKDGSGQTSVTFSFNNISGKELMMKTGLSFVSISNAQKNLEEELENYEFGKVKDDAGFEWEKKLSTLKVKGGKEDNKTELYTLLYQIMIQVNLINDVNGEYINGRGILEKDEENRKYNIISLRKYYQYMQPLIQLTYPELHEEIIKNLSERNILDSINNLPNKGELTLNIEIQNRLVVSQILGFLGLSVNPEDPSRFHLKIPEFEKIIFKPIVNNLPEKQFTIETRNTDSRSITYIQSVILNGGNHSTKEILLNDIAKGGKMLIITGKKRLTNHR
ncbi:MAG: glycoside hydrolase domain-containing protein [Cytophagaceae bacterium]